MHIYIHTYIHTRTHAYIHTYIRAHTTNQLQKLARIMIKKQTAHEEAGIFSILCTEIMQMSIYNHLFDSGFQSVCGLQIQIMVS
jgi:hypothetical protein